MLHQACCARPAPVPAVVDIVKFCTALGAPVLLHSLHRDDLISWCSNCTLWTNNVQVNDCDCIGQTPLFYAVSHCQSADLVPVLLKSGRSIEAGDSQEPQLCHQG